MSSDQQLGSGELRFFFLLTNFPVVTNRFFFLFLKMFLKGIKAALPNNAHKEFDLDSEKNERLAGTVENMDLGIR